MQHKFSYRIYHANVTLNSCFKLYSTVNQLAFSFMSQKKPDRQNEHELLKFKNFLQFRKNNFFLLFLSEIYVVHYCMQIFIVCDFPMRYEST